MNLHDWINQFPKEKRLSVREKLAKKLGISESLVKSMANGNRRIKVDYAPGIQEFTKGQVPITEVCPELIGRISKSLSEARA
jgi:DNA-binding transcriptional regulator YdaS (Cro superfamily)